eukprot:COSAG01_NODE_2537_length_7450_cov_5.509411_5_plen_114_part_00
MFSKSRRPAAQLLRGLSASARWASVDVRGEGGGEGGGGVGLAHCCAATRLARGGLAAAEAEASEASVWPESNKGSNGHAGPTGELSEPWRCASVIDELQRPRSSSSAEGKVDL